MFPSSGEILVIVMVVLILFGGDKIPEVARWFGKAMNELRKATRDLKNELDLHSTDKNDDKNKPLQG
jgi:sec-independent protein translocase protein TatA